MATIYFANGNVKTVTVPTDDTRLKFLQDIVGGLIDRIECDATGELMWLNDESLLLELPFNRMATKWVEAHEPDYLWAGNWIAGDVILLSKAEADAGEREEDDPEVEIALTPERAGRALSATLHYDGIAILQAAAAALEDANFHTESAVIAKMAETLLAQD